MKKQQFFSPAQALVVISLIAVLTLGVASSGFAMGGRNGGGRGNGHGNKQQEMQITTSLSEFEKDALAHMGEEEFLALDVYIVLAEKWDMKIFSNISKSEQRHADKIINLTNGYGVANFSDHQAGVFENQDLQKVYDDLIAKGIQSETDALVVGAIIEDLDIYDLEKFLVQVENPDVRAVFDNLNRGSRNHMRAFTKQLTERGVTYETEYITEDRYAEILAGDHEKGSDHKDGEEKNCDGDEEKGRKNSGDKGEKNMNQKNMNSDSEEMGFWASLWNWFFG